MRLEQVDGGIRLIMPKSGRDLTEPMRGFAATRAGQLAQEDLDGYILKSNSPSCGLMRVRVHGPSGMPNRTGRGFFAEALAEQFPHLPIEEEGRLCDPRLRENWIERVFAYRRIQSFWRSRWTLQRLIAFHTAHKLTVLAHSPRAYQELGRLVAGAKDIPKPEFRQKYHTLFMSTMAVPATRGRHANVLQHMASKNGARLSCPHFYLEYVYGSGKIRRCPHSFIFCQKYVDNSRNIIIYGHPACEPPTDCFLLERSERLSCNYRHVSLRMLDLVLALVAFWQIFF